MLYEAYMADGLLASAGVGWGKTLVSLLLPSVMGAKKALLLVPPNALEKTVREALEYDEHFKISEHIEIMSYGILSHIDYEDALFNINPDLIIADEAHELANLRDSLRCKRVHLFMRDAPDTRFCAMTGTLVKQSLSDYAHLAAWSHKDKSPLPLKWTTLESWRLCIDPPKSMAWPSPTDWARVQPLVDEFGSGAPLHKLSVKARRAEARAAFFNRLKLTPGVVLTEEASTDVPLVLESIENVELPAVCEKALAQLERAWALPGGEFLTTAVEMARARRQLALGFYYRWRWPGGVKDWAWLDARKAWHAELRQVVGKRRLHSAGLVVRDMRRTLVLLAAAYAVKQGCTSPFWLALLTQAEPGELRVDSLFMTWLAWLPQSVKPQPPREAVWLTDEVVREIIHRTDDETIIWYHNLAIADKLEELGVEVFRSKEEPPVKGPVRRIALSMRGHFKAHNLQLWSKNMVISPSSSATVNEQMLGRTHRSKQSASEVKASFMAHTPALRDAVKKALLLAEGARQTTGASQKILEGTWRRLT
ncbi:MAG: DEAD/DEAH box helicase family protein [Phycisphaerales bacterium JB052]